MLDAGTLPSLMGLEDYCPGHQLTASIHPPAQLRHHLLTHLPSKDKPFEKKAFEKVKSKVWNGDKANLQGFCEVWNHMDEVGERELFRSSGGECPQSYRHLQVLKLTFNLFLQNCGVPLTPELCILMQSYKKFLFWSV